MKVFPIKTETVVYGKTDLLAFLKKNLNRLKEESIVAITSKIVSISEGSIIKIGKIGKDALIKQESDYFISRHYNKYNLTLTIKNNVLIPSAGVDESNGNGYYILWPRDPQKTANNIRKFLISTFRLKHVGVIITDSKTTPLRRGTTGVAIAHSGFLALKDYIGKPDIFGRKIAVTMLNIAEALASSAVVEMGEGGEQMPIVVIQDVPFVNFQNRNPNKKELKELNIELDEDLYAPILQAAEWKKGTASPHSNRPG